MDKLIPKQEVITKRVLQAITLLMLAVGVKMFFPTINDALLLLQQATSNLFSAALYGTGAALVVGGAFAFAPAVGLLYKSLARKLTWAMITLDPITPLQDWLKEVNENLAKFEEQVGKIAGIMSSIENKKNDLLQKAKEAQKLYDAGMQQKVDRVDLSGFATIIGANTRAAVKLEAILIRLRPMRDVFEKLTKAYSFNANELNSEIIAQTATWEASQAADEAISAGKKTLGKSKGREFYDMASAHIQESFGESFGRLDNLKKMSEELISTVNIQTGIYDEEAFARWQKAAEPLLLEDQRSSQIELNSSIQKTNIFE